MKQHAPLVVFALLLALALAAMPALAQQGGDFAAQQSALDTRLDGALKDLARERSRIAGQKLPLSKTVSALEAEVASLRKERERFQKVRDASTIDLALSLIHI